MSDNSGPWLRRIAIVGISVASGVYIESASFGAIIFFASLWVNTSMVECMQAALNTAVKCAYIIDPKKNDSK